MATLFDKIWQQHVIVENEGRALLYIDRHYIHEVTSPQAFSGLKLVSRKVRVPSRTYATMDHNIPTTIDERISFKDQQSLKQVNKLIENCQEYGIELAQMGDDNNGIVHVIGPEIGLSFPGQTIVCGDSHTATHGAFANVAFGIGTSEVEHVLATQTLWQTKPKSLGVKIEGKFKNGVGAKDLILFLIAKYGTAFGTGYALEFYGEPIIKMTMDQRMTICNMAIEAGAKYGLVAYDNTTYEFLKDTSYYLENQYDFDQFEDLNTDLESDFDKLIKVNLDELMPYITWGINPSQAVGIEDKLPENNDAQTNDAYEYTKLEVGMNASDIPVDYVFIGSCTNGRLSDLIEGAKYIKGRKVKDNVVAIVVPGSEKTKQEAEKLGIAKLYIDAGFEWRLPGCSACLGMNTDQIPAGMHCISTSNRNFMGRQGVNSITHLSSVPTAVLAAVNGCITDATKEDVR